MLQTTQKMQYLLVRNVGEEIVRAVRLCNFSEWYNKAQNVCLPCRSKTEGGFAFTLEINGQTCTECDDVSSG